MLTSKILFAALLVCLVQCFSLSEAGEKYHDRPRTSSSYGMKKPYYHPTCRTPFYDGYGKYYYKGANLKFYCGHLCCYASCVGPYWMVKNPQCLYLLKQRKCGMKYSAPKPGLGQAMLYYLLKKIGRDYPPVPEPEKIPYPHPEPPHKG